MKQHFRQIKKHWKRSSPLTRLATVFAMFYTVMIVIMFIFVVGMEIKQNDIYETLLERTEYLMENSQTPKPLPAASTVSFEPVIEEPAEHKEIIIPEEEPYIPEISEEEINLIARITWCEAGTECEEGKRLVIDTILNRVDSDKFPDTIEGVIYQPNQFTPVASGAFDKADVKEDIYKLVLEELECRLDDEVVFFRTGRYHKWGMPKFQVGNHYFSSYE